MLPGLSETEARLRLARDGANELPTSRPRSVLRLLREVVTEPMFLLLVACGAIYMLLGDRHEAFMLLGFVFVVMGISFVQQRRSRALARRPARPVQPARAGGARRPAAAHRRARAGASATSCCWPKATACPADMRLLSRRRT